MCVDTAGSIPRAAFYSGSSIGRAMVSKKMCIRDSYNMPTQRAVEMCLFEIKETTVVHSDGHTSINKTPKVTGKGQIYFVNQFLNCLLYTSRCV